VHHGWVRDVAVLNADAGVYLWGCHWVSVTGVTLGTTAYRGDRHADRWEYKDTNGHRGIWSEFGGDNLFQGFFVSHLAAFPSSRGVRRDLRLLARARIKTNTDATHDSHSPPSSSPPACARTHINTNTTTTNKHQKRKQGIDIASKFAHDLSVASLETGDVFRDVKGEDVALDFHKGEPYANLYTSK
jgi:hypothetical protein